jgi:hypothetical protein
MHLNRRTVLFVLGFVVVLSAFVSCTLNNKFNQSNYQDKIQPPGVIPIGSGLYCDRSEITNLDWLAYLHWLNLIYGEQSAQYRSALPNENAWLALGPKAIAYRDYYLRHPAYSGYPVVGITKEQVQAFTKWRSDRVFELLLLRLEMMDHTIQDSTNFFTIEKYYNGDIPTKTNKKIEYYPDYRLPTLDERKRILFYADSVDSAFIQSLKKRQRRKLHEQLPFICCDRLHQDTNFVDITLPWYMHILKFPEDNLNTELPVRYRFIRNWKFLYHVRGNVGEWLAEDGISVGGSWVDSLQTIRRNDIFTTTEANAWTGFRNVCTWKKWEE